MTTAGVSSASISTIITPCVCGCVCKLLDTRNTTGHERSAQARQNPRSAGHQRARVNMGGNGAHMSGGQGVASSKSRQPDQTRSTPSDLTGPANLRPGFRFPELTADQRLRSTAAGQASSSGDGRRKLPPIPSPAFIRHWSKSNYPRPPGRSTANTLPSDPRYDEARAVYNGAVDRRPAAVVRCAEVADVTLKCPQAERRL
jgi:hypothetical protein